MMSKLSAHQQQRSNLASPMYSNACQMQQKASFGQAVPSQQQMHPTTSMVREDFLLYRRLTVCGLRPCANSLPQQQQVHYNPYVPQPNSVAPNIVRASFNLDPHC